MNNFFRKTSNPSSGVGFNRVLKHQGSSKWNSSTRPGTVAASNDGRHSVTGEIPSNNRSSNNIVGIEQLSDTKGLANHGYSSTHKIA